MSRYKREKKCPICSKEYNNKGSYIKHLESELKIINKLDELEFRIARIEAFYRKSAGEILSLKDRILTEMTKDKFV